LQLNTERAEHAEEPLYFPEFKTMAAEQDRLLLFLAFPASLASVALSAVFAISALKQFG